MKLSSMTAPAKCGECGEPVPFNVRECVACGRYVGYPNVRRAEDAKEIEALSARVEHAAREAQRGSYTSVFANFGDVVGRSSNAVIARNLNTLDAFVCGHSPFLVSFYKMVQSGGRVPESNEWDMGRESADSAINPLIKDDIQYAVLSLSNGGADGYGGYFITLKEIMINERASVFEENPFLFCDRHNVGGGRLPPPGYRASWLDRGRLAQAKLFAKLSAGMAGGEFADILLHNGSTVADRDFIEVHIFGPLGVSAIQNVYGPAVNSGPERHIWRRVKKRLSALGVSLEEC